MIAFYQILYTEDQLFKLYPWAIPVWNKTLTPFFENKIISDIVKQSPGEKTAVCSWKLREKITKNLPLTPNSRNLTEEMLQGDFDILSLTVNSKHHEMLANAERWHPGFCDVLRKIGSAIRQTVPREIKFPIYQNHFVAKTDIYKQYVTEFLDPAMKVMEEDEEIKSLCWKDSGYTKLITQPLSEQAQKDLGVTYYPLHAFLCERFFSCWVNNKRFKISHI